MLADMSGFARLVAGLRPFLRDRISTDQARTYVRTQMERRPDLFLEMLAQEIYARPGSPHRQLLTAAGCELEDVRRIVRADGIEATLRCLLSAGVYVTYDEFKGRAAAVRGSQTFHFSHTDFDNPLLTGHFRNTTGGTSGRPATVRSNLQHIAQSAPHWALWFAAHGWERSEVMFWTQVFAGVANRQLMCAKFGHDTHWFAAGHGGTLRDKLSLLCVHGVSTRSGGTRSIGP